MIKINGMRLLLLKLRVLLSDLYVLGRGLG
jgi:hypothetical protein